MSPYVFTADLCGLICSDCPEQLANITVRLYRGRSEQNVTALSAAAPKETFAALSDKDVEAKHSSLLAEATTDDRGKVVFELGGRDRYDGEPFEVDIAMAAVPGQAKPARSSRQFSITMVQPAWREGEAGSVAAWDYCIPHRIWCWIRGLFGAWTICGHVTNCATKQPIGGVKVRAFDRDWTQDDELGSAVTDGSGRFRVDYTPASFKPGTFIDVELCGGPDLYFKVETTGAGAPLLIESPSRARQPDRENVGPCFCVDLCIEQTPPSTNEPAPAFTHIGYLDYLTHVHSAAPGNGLTIADKRAFYSTLRLNGILAKRLNGTQMEYRFETRPTDATGASAAGWTPVPTAQIPRTNIGRWEIYAPAFAGDPHPIKHKEYVVNGTPGPAELAPSVVSGWIRVPQESNVFGPEGYFTPNNYLQDLDTIALAASASLNKTGLKAGASGAPLAVDKHFGVRMVVREVGDAGPGADVGTCSHIAVSNTHYDDVLHHPNWMPELGNDVLGVALLNILQLVNVPCSEIGDALDVQFTATHPHLGAVSVTMKGPGGPYGFTLPAPASPGEDWFGIATPNFVVHDLPKCAYIVHLSAVLLLTTGEAGPDPIGDEIPFCKG